MGTVNLKSYFTILSNDAPYGVFSIPAEFRPLQVPEDVDSKGQFKGQVLFKGHVKGQASTKGQVSYGGQKVSTKRRAREFNRKNYKTSCENKDASTEMALQACMLLSEGCGDGCGDGCGVH